MLGDLPAALLDVELVLPVKLELDDALVSEVFLTTGCRVVLKSSLVIELDEEEEREGEEEEEALVDLLLPLGGLAMLDLIIGGDLGLGGNEGLAFTWLGDSLVPDVMDEGFDTVSSFLVELDIFWMGFLTVVLTTVLLNGEGIGDVGLGLISGLESDVGLLRGGGFLTTPFVGSLLIEGSRLDTGDVILAVGDTGLHVPPSLVSN